MPMKFCLLLSLLSLSTCKALIKSNPATINTHGCAYIQKKEDQLFAQASRIQDTLFVMLSEFDAHEAEYEQRTGKTLSFIDRKSQDWQEFILEHQEKSTSFRALQEDMHKVYEKLQMVNAINYTSCRNDKRLELAGTNYGLLADKKPISCSNYHAEIEQEKQKIAELNKVFSTTEKDVSFHAQETDTLSVEADKLESLSNKLLYAFMGSEALTIGAIGGYAQIAQYLGTATPYAIAGIEVADFVLSLAWIYTSTEVQNLRLEALRLRSKYQLMGIDNKTVLKELRKTEGSVQFLENMFKNYCGGN